MNAVVGIDPGLQGGLALLDCAGEGRVVMSVMPVVGTDRKQIDETSVRTWLEECQLSSRQRGCGLVAYVEKVSAMPKQGVTSMFTFGTGWGLVRGILCGLKIPYHLVLPRQWQNDILAGLDRSDTKTAAYSFASRAWPNERFLATPRSRVPHKGLVDAICIAEHGRRAERGERLQS